MYKEIIKRYNTDKEPIIDTEFFTIEEYYQNNGYILLAKYVSFLDFSELLFLIIIVRFLCSWRIIVFIYLGYILCQIYFSIYFINTNYKNTTLSVLPLVDNIELILSSLFIPFGSIIRSKLKKEYLIIVNGGGFFITNNNTIIGKRTFTKESDNLDLTNFVKSYMETHKHPKIGLNLVHSYTDSFKVYKYDKCIELFKDCNINQKKCLMSLSNNYFSTNKGVIIKTKLFNDDLFLAQHRLFLAESNKLILDNAEKVFNVKFLIPKQKYDDLISLDSAQPLVSKSWTFESIGKEYRRNHFKMEELLDTALTQGNKAYTTLLSNVGETVTQADCYSCEVAPSAVSLIGEVKKGRYTLSEVHELLESIGVSKPIIIAVDNHRKNPKNPSAEVVIDEIIQDKINPFYNICTNFPQHQHELAVILPTTITLQQKEIIDSTIQNYIEEKNNVVLTSMPKLSFKSVIDTFLD